MLMSADMVGGWIKKCQTHADVILEWSLSSSKHVLSEMISSHFVPLVATLNSVVRAGLRRTYIRSRSELKVYASISKKYDRFDNMGSPISINDLWIHTYIFSVCSLASCAVFS